MTRLSAKYIKSHIKNLFHNDYLKYNSVASKCSKQIHVFINICVKRRNIAPLTQDIIYYLRTINVHSDTFCTTPDSYAVLQEHIHSIIIRLFENILLPWDYIPCHRSTEWINDMIYSEQTIVNNKHHVHWLPIPHQKVSQQSLLSRLEDTISTTTWHHPSVFVCSIQIYSNYLDYFFCAPKLIVSEI